MYIRGTYKVYVLTQMMFHCCPHVCPAGVNRGGFVRCGSRTCVQPYAHLEPNVKVTRAGVVHGYGVVARRDMFKDDIVCTYSATICTDYLFCTNRSRYIVKVPWWNARTNAWELWYLDAASPNATAGRYINGIKGTGKKANVAFSYLPLERDPRHGFYYINVVATCNIRVGEELLVEYGPGYWDAQIMVNRFVQF